MRRLSATALVAGLGLAWLTAAPLSAQAITGAQYAAPTTRYAHGILGDAVEWGALVLTLSDGTRRRHVLPQRLVFEDTAPRLADLDGDGAPEVIVVESDRRKGARLAIWSGAGRMTATPHIGQANRWLAPVGAADLDGDGRMEIAYVDRPHLARVLRIWRYSDTTLTQVASAAGLTNHRIGWPDIPGGLRRCDKGVEMVLASADWRQVIAARFDGQKITARAIAPLADKDSLNAALTCPR
ncbi:FG-GAP repeat domain-containing protein [Pseudooceanicola aestuarii]|uniref:FG-GAP repeat domain-containing protein n=1 Tax=Pseudooceanicola aestuarii TaxID=2697319 RepID=UPI0013D37142|nr:VCBS repeat-containing protein [Pseudooceanicola aestuarii]